MDPTQLDAAALLNNLHTGVVVHAPDTAIVYANPRALDLLRLTRDQALGRDAFDQDWRFLDAFHRPLPTQQYPVNRVLAERQPVMNQEVGVEDSSSERITWALCNAYPEFDDAGDIRQIVVTFIDITAQKNAIPFKSIVELANDMVLVMAPSGEKADQDWQIVYTNQAFTQRMGYTREEIKGRPPGELHSPEIDNEQLARLRNAMSRRQSIREQMPKRSKIGREFWIDINLFPLYDESGELIYYAAIERDVTGMKEAEEKLHRLSVRDHLTGLYNRRGFEELAAQAIKNARRNDQPLSFAMVDIDHFKQVNDTYGHATGDVVLSALASQLTDSFRESDLLARLGGEEFGILMMNTTEDSAAEKLEQLRRLIETTALAQTGNGGITLTVSAGLFAPTVEQLQRPVEDTIPELLRHADEALYAAKRQGRNRIVRKA